MTEQRRTNGLAIASMVCGICGLVIPWVGFILAILGIIFGGVAISQTQKDPSLGGRGMAIAGMVCGIVGIGLRLLLIVVIGVFA